MQKIYHYTTDVAWRGMQGESADTILSGIDAGQNDVKALKEIFDHFAKQGRVIAPANRFIQMPKPLFIFNPLPKWAHENVVEALTAPVPAKWLESKDQMPPYENFFDYFVKMITHEHNPVKKIANNYKLLEIELTPGDEVYVSDIAPYVGESGKLLHQARTADSKRKMVTSLVSAFVKAVPGCREYCNLLKPIQDEGAWQNYSLPVVASWKPFPLEQVRVMETYSKAELLELTHQ